MPSRSRKRCLRCLAVAALVFILCMVLFGCTSVEPGVYGRSIADGGTMVGPYDITLTSHQEALGLRVPR